MRPIKKMIYLLNVDDYSSEITRLTYPLIETWADKIGADIFEIGERKFPDWPVVYEKLQVHEFGKLHNNDWNIYLDSDTLVHPEMIDPTLFLRKDQVMHNASDMANVRWTYNEWFLRDGRNIGSCNWFTVASDWCLDLWRPLDMTLDEALANIYPTRSELETVINAEHLIDDYALSCNIARFGLKFKPFMEVQSEVGLPQANFFWHVYTVPTAEKVIQIKKVLKEWGL